MKKEFMDHIDNINETFPEVTNAYLNVYERLDDIGELVLTDIVDKPGQYSGRSKIQGRSVGIRTEPKIERNSICTCGSGKKFKKCCIKKP